MKTTLLLSALVAAASAVEIPTDPAQKYWPNGRPADLDKRSLNPQAATHILAVKKITSDSEKFYPSQHWITGQTITDFYGSELNVTHTDLPRLLRPAARILLPQDLSPEGVLRLFKRQDRDGFTCPTNHYACTGINRPNFCCGTNENCEIIQDGGIGDVGCCPRGQNCLGTVRDCGDKKACSRELGGGCCVNGYRCTVGGCNIGVPEGSQTTTTVPPTQTSTCEEGFYACPASLGGGCCRVGRVCAVSDCPAEGDAEPQPTPTDEPDNSNCPSGYFSCGSEYSGGCCRIGRACAVNSCPIATGTDVPVVVGGTCAEGWYGCPADRAGGCCPDGYDCGLTDCPARGANMEAVGKQRVIPGGVGRGVGISVGAVVAGVVGGVVMLLV
ncbi:hypothetical protein BJ508DRAFT_218260 [Ascobolus immersus RN42]|uniref:GPI anchored protein n=1 Tax=Ascobolus immersus RN42 TaxID=1160509 RepID=A0A3N4HFQ5_ASCIM|nr:hypothetical protein BJ508DRAFT_218260 [Ascobolus immersus RN42]